MTRFVSVTVLVMAVLIGGGVARAQVTTPPPTTGTALPNGVNIWFEHLQIIKDGQPTETEQASPERLHYFNLAHCNCAREKQGMEQTFSYLIEASASPMLGRAVQLDLWAGSTTCTNDDLRDPTTNCKLLGSIADIDVSLFPSGTRKDFSLYDVVNGQQNQGAPCIQTDGGSGVLIYAFANTMGTNTSNAYDFKTNQVVGSQYPETPTQTVLDTGPPPLPTLISATSTDSGIRMSWTPPEADNTDIAYYQALCAKMDGTEARDKAAEALYVTTKSLCDVTAPEDADAALSPAPLNNDGMTVALPTGRFGDLEDSFICGSIDGGTSSSLKISGLTNGTPYQMILLAVDVHGNYSGAYLTSTVTPVPAIDFWEDLNARDNNVEGGFCLLAETYGDDSSLTNTLRAFRDDTLGGSGPGRWLTARYYGSFAAFGRYVHGSLALRIAAGIALAPVVVFALLWHWLSLPGLAAALALLWLWRRRRAWLIRAGSRLAARRLALAAGALLVLGASEAHAGGYQPYWENSNISSEDDHVSPDDPSLVTWHVGVRVGPYLPDVDKQLGATKGPFAQMFGGSRPMPMLDVDRVLWTGFGQVTAGISVGYMQWFAHQFVDMSTPDQTPRMRSPRDTNRFRLIPIELTAGYRFTYLDEEYGIPVVPYVRGGLAYDIWTLESDGDHVCKDGSSDPMCETDPPHGGSLGVEGAIGLAVRAERIDAATANSMRQSGIMHAGIYGELSIAKVNGFGSDKKLSVGDRTWFAGVDFEF